MENIVLVPISIDNIEILNLTEYKNLSIEKRKLLVQDSENGTCKGEFFRFYLIKNGKETVGVINMCGHGVDRISVAPEIFERFRNKGYAIESLSMAYVIAKENGFKEVIAGIRGKNIASQRLHEKMGFTFVGSSISKRGNLIKNYSKRI